MLKRPRTSTASLNAMEEESRPPKAPSLALGGLLGGLDGTPYVAELWACYMCLLVAHGARVQGCIMLIDNTQVVRTLETASAPASRLLPRRCPGLWAEVLALMRGIPDAELHWVPSHGKRRDWTAPREGGRSFRAS